MNINTKKYYDYESIGGGMPDDVIKEIEEMGTIYPHCFTFNDGGRFGYSLAAEKLKEKEQEIERLKQENERLRGEGDITAAIKVITNAMLKDKSEGSYYHSWQANIAMSFKDEYQRFNPNMSDGNKHILHTIANNAAKNFLDLLCLLIPPPPKSK